MYSNHNNSPIFRCLNFILRFSDLPLPFMPGHLRDLDGCSWLVLIPLVGYRFRWAWTCLMICDVTCIIWLRVAWAFEWDDERWVSKTMFRRACRAVGSQGFGSFDSFRFVGFSETGSPCFHVWSSVGSSVAKTFLGRFPARESWSWVRSTTIDEFLRQATLYQVSRSPFYFEAKAAYKKSRRTKMFWCCTNTDDAEDMAMPQLHNSEQVLPFGKELTKELKTLQRSQTAAKLIDKESPDFFTIRLHRTPGSSFGLDVSAVGRVCMVNDVHPNSLVGEWNQQCLEEGDPKQVVQQWLRCSHDTSWYLCMARVKRL